MTEVRIDKWLWAVRLFKTRALSAEACKEGHVYIGSHQAKPSSSPKIGDLLLVKTDQLTRTLKVIGLTDKRVGAPLVKTLLEDLTPESEYARAREVAAQNARPQGTGRPTKKDRRLIEKFLTQ